MIKKNKITDLQNIEPTTLNIELQTLQRLHYPTHR
jgi:hypothetical protein